MTTDVSASVVKDMCNAQINELIRLNNEANEHRIKYQMTRSLFNWFPAKTREKAIEIIKRDDSWDVYHWRIKWYEDALRLVNHSKSKLIMVPRSEAWRFKILDV